MDNRIDLFGAAAFCAVGGVVVGMALTYPPTKVVFDAIGPMGFPLVLGAGLIALGVSQAVRSALLLRRVGPQAPDEGIPDEPEHSASSRRALGFLAGSFVYMLALSQLGFFVSSVPALALALWSMDYRRPAKLAAVSIGFAVLAYVTFFGVLAVPLPAGPLEQLVNPYLEIGR